MQGIWKGEKSDIVTGIVTLLLGGMIHKLEIFKYKADGNTSKGFRGVQISQTII